MIAIFSLKSFSVRFSWSILLSLRGRSTCMKTMRFAL